MTSVHRLMTQSGVQRSIAPLLVQLQQLQQAIESVQSDIDALPSPPDLSPYVQTTTLNSAISDVLTALNSLQTVVNDKAPSAHTHQMIDVEGIAEVLNRKAEMNHTHSFAVSWDSPGAIGATTPNTARFSQLTVLSGSSTVIQTDTAGVRFPFRVGFYDKTPIGKPSVTGSRSGNAALNNLLASLANLGLITNNTTA